jgi:hypothetical protein
VLAWIVLALGGLLTPISGISLLMLVAGSHGTASADAMGILSVVVAPPVAVVAGIGLLRRRRWAWFTVLVLLGGVVALNVRELATARPTTTTHTSPSGVGTTVMASGPNYHSLPLIALALAAMAKLLTRAVRAEAGVRAPGRGPSTPAVPAPAAMPVAAARPAVAVHAPPVRPTATPRQRATAWLAVVLLCGTAGGLGWVVKNGVARGSTRLPIHRASFQRAITREAEPAMFWFSLGLYATFGLAAGGAAAWLTRETLRLQRPRR